MDEVYKIDRRHAIRVNDKYVIWDPELEDLLQQPLSDIENLWKQNSHLNGELNHFKMVTQDLENQVKVGRDIILGVKSSFWKRLKFLFTGVME